MKKILIFMSSILFFTSIFADEPHIVPAAGCPAGQLCCPIQLVCDYLMGCGAMGIWHYIEQPHEFTGMRTYNLAGVGASAPRANGNYNLQCGYTASYSTDPHPEFDNISITTNGNNYSLVGAWQYDFAKLSAHCPTVNSIECTAKLD